MKELFNGPLETNDFNDSDRISVGQPFTEGSKTMLWSRLKQILAAIGGNDTNAIHKNVSSEIFGLTAKSSLVDADVFVGENSENSYSKIKATWANIKNGLSSLFLRLSLSADTSLQQNGHDLRFQSTWGSGNRYSTEIMARNNGYIGLYSFDDDAAGKYSQMVMQFGNIEMSAGAQTNGNYGQFMINESNSYWAYYDDATELDGLMYMGSRGASYAADYSAEFNTNDRAIPDVGWINSKITLKQNVFPGFDPLTPITISIDYVTRVLTITPTLAYFNFFTDGAGVSVKHTKTGAQNFPAFTNTSGIWYFYYDSSGNAVVTQTQWTDFDTITTVYRLLWNASETGARKAVVESCEHHENTIPAIDHLWKHAYRTINISGFDCINNKLASGSPNASGLNTVIGFTTGRNMDDNLLYTITNSTSGDRWQQDLGEITPANLTISNGALIDIRYDSGGLQYRLDATRFPFAWDSGTNRPQYITSAGVRTLVSNQYHFVYFVYSIQDPRNGKGIMLVSAPGQYNTITDAKAINWADIQAAYPTINDHEVRPLARIIFQYNQTYDAAIKYSVIRDVQDIRSVPITSTTASGTVLGSSVTTSATTNITSTNVQSDKEQIDNKAIIQIPSTQPVIDTGIMTLDCNNHWSCMFEGRTSTGTLIISDDFTIAFLNESDTKLISLILNVTGTNAITFPSVVMCSNPSSKGTWDSVNRILTLISGTEKIVELQLIRYATSSKWLLKVSEEAV